MHTRISFSYTAAENSTRNHRWSRDHHEEIGASRSGSRRRTHSFVFGWMEEQMSSIHPSPKRGGPTTECVGNLIRMVRFWKTGNQPWPRSLSDRLCLSIPWQPANHRAFSWKENLPAPSHSGGHTHWTSPKPRVQQVFPVPRTLYFQQLFFTLLTLG